MSRFTIFSPQFYPRDFASPGPIFAGIQRQVENFRPFDPQPRSADGAAWTGLTAFRVQAVIRRQVEMLISPASLNRPLFINNPSFVHGALAHRLSASSSYCIQKPKSTYPQNLADYLLYDLLNTLKPVYRQNPTLRAPAQGRVRPQNGGS
jgi:hypothetical protein